MKNLLLSLLILLSVGFSSHAQSMKDEGETDNKGRKIHYNHLKINLVGLALGHYGLAYERKLGKKTSAQLAFDVVSLNLPSVNNSGISVVPSLGGYGIQPEFRYYLGRNAMRGFFIGSYVNIRQYKVSTNYSGDQSYNIIDPNNQVLTPVILPTTGNITASLNQYGVGFVTGAQFIIGSHVSLGFHLGASFGSGTIDISGNSSARGPNPFNTPVNYTSNESTSLFTYNAVHGGNSSTITVNPENISYKNIPSSLGVLPRFGINLGYVFGK